ncbi:MAG: TolC family protein, partial [Terriglobia bacterium]
MSWRPFSFHRELSAVFRLDRRGWTRWGKRGMIAALLWLRLIHPALAQVGAPLAFDYSQNPQSFPRLYKLYRMREVPGPNLENSPVLTQGVREGVLSLSLAQLLAAVVENNLDLAAARYNLSMAQTDLLRARSGQAPRGTDGVPIPGGLFAGAIGAGLGGGGGGGGGDGRRGGGEGGISGNARQVRVGQRGNYDPNLNMNFSVDTETSPLNTLRVSGIAAPTSHTANFQMFYAQAFTTGTSFSLGWNAQRESSNQRSLRFNPSFTSRLNFSLNQQLLSGSRRSINRRFQRVAENNSGVAREAFRQQAMVALGNAQNLYWDLVAAREQVRAAEQGLAVAERLREDNRKQAQIGTLAPLDVVAAEAEVAARRRDLIAAQTAEQLREVQLKTAMSKELTDVLGAARIETTDSLPEPQDSDIPALEDALMTAMRNRPEIARAEGGIRNQQIVTEFTKDNLKPEFSIFGLWAGSSREGALRRALGQLGRFDFPEYAFGFALTILILNRCAQADDVRARLELRQAETSLQRTRNQIQLEVRNAIIALLQAKAQAAA